MTTSNAEKLGLPIDLAIFAAMREELAALRDAFSSLPVKLIKVGSLEFNLYHYQQANILVVYTGIGTTFAAGILTLIHAHFQPTYHILVGTAGGIVNGVKINDVIIVENAFEAEMQNIFSLVKNTPFEGCLQHPLLQHTIPTMYAGDPALLAAARSIEIKNINILPATIVSSNAFPAPKALFANLQQLNPYAIDMETSAFYQTAWLLNIKVLAIRGISNLLNENGTDDNLNTSDIEGSMRAATHVLLALIDNLSLSSSK